MGLVFPDPRPKPKTLIRIARLTLEWLMRRRRRVTRLLIIISDHRDLTEQSGCMSKVASGQCAMNGSEHHLAAYWRHRGTAVTVVDAAA